MEDFTFYFSFFDDLEKFEYDPEEFVFNGYSVDDFGNYREYLRNQQKDFEKKLDAVIINDTYPTDKLIRNFGVMNLKFSDIYTHTKEKYSKFVNRHKYLSPPKGEENASRKIPSGRFVNNPKLKKLDAIIGFHVSILQLTKDCINARFMFVSSSARGVRPETKPTTQIDGDNAAVSVIETSSAEVKNSDKLLLNLSKREIALAFMLLSEAGYINHNSKTELYSFIENNFKYVKSNRGQKTVSEIKQINVEFSRWTDMSKDSENKKALEKFLSRYSLRIDESVEKLKKTKLFSFREK